MSLESKHYVATAEDVAQITREVLNAQKTNRERRDTYLSALVATTQAELNEHPRQRMPTASKKLDDETRVEQLAALEKVNARFYAIVVRVAKETLEGPDRGGRQLNRRTGFARSSKSAIYRWIRAGNDITGLVASRVTKRLLAVAGRKRGPSLKVLGNQTHRFGTRLEQTLLTFAASDKEAAAEQWAKLKARMERIFARRTGNGARAAAERRIAA